MTKDFKPTHKLNGQAVQLLSDEFHSGKMLQVKYEKDLSVGWARPEDLVATDLNGLILNDFVLTVLENGKYAVFINKLLYEIIIVENYDTENHKYFKYETPVIARTGSKDMLTAQEYMATLPKNTDPRIVLANQIILP